MEKQTRYIKTPINGSRLQAYKQEELIFFFFFFSVFLCVEGDCRMKEGAGGITIIAFCIYKFFSFFLSFLPLLYLSLFL